MARVLCLVCLLLFGTACEESRPARLPLAPSALPAAQASVVVLSGTVYEYTSAGRRPLPNVPLDISVEYQSWPPQVTSDEEGRYSIKQPLMSELKVRAEATGYNQPCRAGTVLNADATVDVHLVPDGILSTAGAHSSMPIAEPRISGRVFERRSAGTQPISGARVIGDFTGGLGWAPSATTLSDALGRYMLCGTQSQLGLELVVSKPGYRSVAVPVNSGVTTVDDIELQRQ